MLEISPVQPFVDGERHRRRLGVLIDYRKNALLEPLFLFVGHFVARVADKLDPVVSIGIVRGRYHDPGRERSVLGKKSDARCGSYTRKCHLYLTPRESSRHFRGQPWAGLTSVHSNYDLWLLRICLTHPTP